MTPEQKLTCRQVSRILSDGLDASMPEERRAQLRLHLTICEACRNVEQQLKLMREAMRMLGVDDTDPQDPSARG